MVVKSEDLAALITMSSIGHDPDPLPTTVHTQRPISLFSIPVLSSDFLLGLVFLLELHVYSFSSESSYKYYSYKRSKSLGGESVHGKASTS
jgi:hypothetical protein